jgi:hypothetical protein
VRGLVSLRHKLCLANLVCCVTQRTNDLVPRSSLASAPWHDAQLSFIATKAVNGPFHIFSE